MLLLLFCGCSFLCSKCSSFVVRTAKAKVIMHGHIICSVLQMKSLKVLQERQWGHWIWCLKFRVSLVTSTTTEHKEHKPCCIPVLKDLEKPLKALNELTRHNSPPQKYRKFKIWIFRFSGIFRQVFSGKFRPEIFRNSGKPEFRN